MSAIPPSPFDPFLCPLLDRFSQEITIHQTLRRHFWWYEGIIFLEDIRCPVFFHLSGKDEIVPSAAIRAYIDKYCATHHAEEHDSHLAKHPIVEVRTGVHEGVHGLWHPFSHVAVAVFTGEPGEAVRHQGGEAGVHQGAHPVPLP